jgi:hypothetical protein
MSAKTYSYEVDVVRGEYSVSHTIDDVTQFNADSMWVTFYTVGGETLAVFAAGAVVSVIKDVDSGKDVSAA